MATTPTRGLPLMAGSDLAATIDDTYDAALDILDGVTVLVEDTFALRPTPAAALRGTFFKPTDLPGYLYLSDGSNWIEVAPGMGSVPIGSSLDWWGSNDPGDTRFVKMDGRSLSTTDYAALYALIGNAYDTMHGAIAPGAGLFRIPNLSGHVIVGAGTSPKAGISARTLAQTGGEENHVLTTAEIPSHLHDSGLLTANLYTNVGGSLAPSGSLGLVGTTSPAFRGGYADILGNTGSAGGDGAHNNMPPWVAANRIIRIA